MRIASRYLLLSTALTLVSRIVCATTIVMPTDAQLVEKSPAIVIASVVGSETVERDGGIWTETVLRVERSVRGSLSGEVIVRELGGVMGERVNVVFGSPRYRIGERVFAFLAPTPRGDYQTVDLFVGKFTERFSVEGTRIWFRDDAHAGTRVLDERFVERIATHVQRSADGFENFVGAVARGHSAIAAYWIEKPQMARSIGADFTLIDEPNLYRWFTFDDGGSAVWRHTGTQTGYSNGGVGELQAGLNAWSGYSQAKIRYSYGGASSGAPGGLEIPNGLNEVMFGDPRNEIAGTWNGNSGVVGRGGFNSLKGFRTWTSPFSADAGHPARTYSGVGDIAEGNLVIQDGVAPNKGISSAMLAEILAHEFGHTLGFGHSADGSALMFASVSGGGAGLRADDQLSARWLYPVTGGSGPSPTAPAAPTNLTATGSGNSLVLNWTDNAANETVHTIYVGTGSGSLLPVQSAAVNATSAVIPNLTAGQIYYARVSASNAAGESPLSNLAQAAIPGEVLKAAFIASPTSGIAGVTSFTFIDKSTGTVASRQWTLGDGSTSPAATVTHVFTTGGSFNVTLRVFDKQGNSSSAQKQIVVGATAQSIASAFSSTPSAPVAGEEVAFTDESAGPVKQWLWSFGDGGTSTERNPRRRYVYPGTYEVTLTVTNGSESSTATRWLSIATGSGATPTVHSAFEISTLWPGTDREISFFDRSAGSPNSWLWDFGDGTQSTQQNPVKTYTSPGNYVVSLRVQNAASFSQQEMSINVEEAQQRAESLVPTAALTAGAGQSFWRTELTISNAGSSSANIDLLYIPSAGGSPLRKSIVLGGGGSVTYPNALADLFGLSMGSGAVTVEATSAGTSAPDIRLSSRTFTTGAHGTYGQYVPAGNGDRTSRRFIAGLEWSESYRTNIGLVNLGDAPITFTLSLFDETALRPIGIVPVTLPAHTFRQSSLMSDFAVLDGSSQQGLVLRIETSGTVNYSAYASMIDNRTQDPIFIPARGAEPGNVVTVPAVARTEGARGTFWRSDVVIFNPATTALDISVRLLGKQNARTMTLPSGKTAIIEDVVTWLGEKTGGGALQIASTGSETAPIVWSRTYTGGSEGGTYGQWIDGSAVSQFRKRSYVLGLRHDADFRTNAGLVNRGDVPLNATVSILGDAGVIASVPVTVPARGSLQQPVSALFPGVDTAAVGAFSLRVDSTGDLLAYGSVIDNVSGDPVFVSGY